MLLQLCLLAVLQADVPLEPIVEASPPAPEPKAVATDAPQHAPLHVGAELGFDVPTQGLPMASLRADFGQRLTLSDALFADVALRSGYSYVARSNPVEDALRGVDAGAFSMVHRVPLRVAGRLGAHGDRLAFVDGPGEAGLVCSVGADVAIASAHSFGRTVDVVAVVPGFSVGGFAALWFGAMQVGVLGELDQARVAGLSPGLDGDLSAARVSVFFSTSFGG